MPVLRRFTCPEPESEALRHLCQQIRMAPGESWSSAQAAGIVGMSERTLNRHFQQQTGLSYGEWVRRARLLEALVAGAGPAELRVALDLGYGSHSAFDGHVSPGNGSLTQRLLPGTTDRVQSAPNRRACHVIIDAHAPVAGPILEQTQRI